jgi:hypothetical protein
MRINTQFEPQTGIMVCGFLMLAGDGLLSLQGLLVIKK